MTETVSGAALVTGGASGIGESAARVLAARGVAVIVADQDVDAASAVAADIEAGGGSARHAHVDVADSESAEGLFEELRSLGMPIDRLVNSAGIASRFPFQDVPAAEWERVLSVNLTGTMRMTQLLVRDLLTRGAVGAVVNVTSVMAHFAAPNLAAYVSSKGGVAMLTRATALELAPHGIRVNAVSPGYIRTGMTVRSLQVPRFRDAVLAATPMGRFGTPEDVARVIAFLLSDDAAYVTGQVLPVDGGMSAGDASLAAPSADELAAVPL